MSDSQSALPLLPLPTRSPTPFPYLVLLPELQREVRRRMSIDDRVHLAQTCMALLAPCEGVLNAPYFMQLAEFNNRGGGLTLQKAIMGTCYSVHATLHLRANLVVFDFGRHLYVVVANRYGTLVVEYVVDVKIVHGATYGWTLCADGDTADVTMAKLLVLFDTFRSLLPPGSLSKTETF